MISLCMQCSRRFSHFQGIDDRGKKRSICDDCKRINKRAYYFKRKANVKITEATRR